MLKKPPPIEKKKVPPIEKKKSPPVVKKKQLEPEPEKKGRHPWITKFWKEKEVPEKIYSDYQCYVAERVRNGFSGAALDKYLSLDDEEEGYNPG